MPRVGNKHFAYTPAGYRAANAAKKAAAKKSTRKRGGMSIQPVGRVKKVR